MRLDPSKIILDLPSTFIELDQKNDKNNTGSNANHFPYLFWCQAVEGCLYLSHPSPFFQHNIQVTGSEGFRAETEDRMWGSTQA